MYGERVFLGTGIKGAEGDKFFGQFMYVDTSAALTNGQPVYVQVTDAAEWNAQYSSTALSPAAVQTGGNVVLATNSNATNIFCVGVYQPQNPNDTANASTAVGNYVPIRVLMKGRGLVAVTTPNSNGTTVAVGNILIANSGTANAQSNGSTYLAGKTIGIALASGAHITAGAQLLGRSGTATVATTVINAYVDVR